LDHIAGVRSVTRSGGRIGNDDIFKVILGDGADGEGVYGGESVKSIRTDRAEANATNKHQ
jgi:hypothetical protein